VTQIREFHVFQTAKILAILYLVLTSIFMVPIGFLIILFGNLSQGVVFLFMPIVYLIAMFIITCVYCAIYNWPAEGMGGIMVELEMVHDQGGGFEVIVENKPPSIGDKN